MPRKILLLLPLVLLAACAKQPELAHADDPGFWMGIVHGWIMPFSFIGSLFSDTIRIYAYPNTGVWYDFGYILGLSIWGGGAAAKKRR